jgi:hypothetical protein
MLYNRGTVFKNVDQQRTELDMLWGIWIFAALVAATMFILYMVEDRRGLAASGQYRKSYLHLTSRLEALVESVNRLSETVMNLRDTRILDSYHSHLKMLETLLEATKKIPPFGIYRQLLDAPLFISEDIAKRVTLLAKDIDRVHNRRQMTSDGSSTILELAPAIGCYFCSRPFDPKSFHKVRVKVDGEAQDVTSCEICRSKLLSGKKAKVLFFAENGATVHWSKAKDYVPSAQFWSINEDPKEQEKVAAKPHLTLVYSNVTKLSSQIKDE